MGQKLHYMVVELVQVKAITFFFIIQDGHRDSCLVFATGSFKPALSGEI